MKALILTEGSRAIGLGHVARCHSFYQGFVGQGWKVRFIVKGDRKAKEFVVSKKIRAEIVPDLRGIELAGYDLALIDSYHFAARIYKVIAEKNGLLISIDDYKRMIYPAGFVVNGSILAPTLNYPKKPGRHYLLGPKYQPLPKAYWRTKRQAAVHRSVRRVLVTFGAKDVFHLSAGTIDAILNVKDEALARIDVIGCNDSKRPISKMINGVEVVLHPPLKSLKALILKADLAISAGGQTLYELACCGVPIIGVCLADNQRLNLRGMKAAGNLEYVGWYNGPKYYQQLKLAWIKLQARNRRVAMARAGVRQINGSGISAIIKAIEKQPPSTGRREK